MGPQEMLDRAEVKNKWKLTPLKNFKSPRLTERMWRTALVVLDHFTLDPRDQMNAIKDMRANGLKPLGNWHSHPSSPSRPSVEDIRLAFDSKASYLILLLIADYPVLNSFHIENGEWTKEDLRIYSEEYYF